MQHRIFEGGVKKENTQEEEEEDDENGTPVLGHWLGRDKVLAFGCETGGCLCFDIGK